VILFLQEMERGRREEGRQNVIIRKIVEWIHLIYKKKTKKMNVKSIPLFTSFNYFSRKKLVSK